MQFPHFLPQFPPVGARTRLLLARRPWLYWLVVVTAGLVCWWAVQSALTAAQQQTRSWGTTRTVWVATTPLAPGDAWAVEPRDYPLAMVPAAAVGTEPTGVVGRDVADGAVVVGLDLATANAPDGWVAMALPVLGAPQLTIGDGVTVFGNGAAVCDGVVDGQPSAEGDTVDVWLPPACAAEVAAHVQAGTVVLARLR